MEKDIKSKQPFYVDDGTGKVLVDPSRVELAMNARNVKYETGGLLKGRKRITEWYILDNEPVYIIGSAYKARDFLKEFRIKLNEELRALKKDPERMKHFDENNDGVIDAQEWEKAVETIENEIKESELENTERGPLADVAIGYDEDHNLFIISDKSEKDLLSGLARKTAMYFLGSIMLFIVSICIVVPQFITDLFFQ